MRCCDQKASLSGKRLHALSNESQYNDVSTLLLLPVQTATVTWALSGAFKEHHLVALNVLVANADHECRLKPASTQCQPLVSGWFASRAECQGCWCLMQTNGTMLTCQ